MICSSIKDTFISDKCESHIWRAWTIVEIRISIISTEWTHHEIWCYWWQNSWSGVQKMKWIRQLWHDWIFYVFLHKVVFFLVYEIKVQISCLLKRKNVTNFKFMVRLKNIQPFWWHLNSWEFCSPDNNFPWIGVENTFRRKQCV